MSKNWFRKQQPKINTEELMLKAEKSIKHTKSQQAYVNVLVAYLEKRKNQNGFGEDFEYTLKRKGRHA